MAPGTAVASSGDQPAAGPLSPTDLQRVAELSKQVDVSDSQAVLAYGLPAQSRIANFADSLLGDVRNKDAGSGGEALQDLLKKVREIDVDALSSGSGKSKIPILGRFANTFDRFSSRYQKVATSIEKILDALERSRMALLKDMTVLDKMYELNLDYLKQLDVYIAAGEQALTSCTRSRSRRSRPRSRPAATSWPRSGWPTCSRPRPGSSAASTTSSSRA